MRRVIYSLALELECEPPQSMELIVPLDRDGKAEKTYVLGKRRMIDVRAGDLIQHPDGRFKVIGVKAWQERWLEEGAKLPDHGYVVRQ